MFFFDLKCLLSVVAVTSLLSGYTATAADIEGSTTVESLERRIMSPNLTKRYQVRQFSGANTSAVRTDEVKKKEYYWVSKSLRKDLDKAEFYAGTESRNNGFRISGKRFGTGKAYMGRYARNRDASDSQYQTETYETRAARTGGRQQDVKQTSDAKRQFDGRGTAQGTLDKLSNNPQQLSVDELREILNRNQ